MSLTPAYRPRILDGELEQALTVMGAVLIEGAKATGKTSSAERVASTSVHLDSDQVQRELAETAPHLLLAQEPPLLVDEWQVVPAIWNQVRREVDVRRLPGQFILTGSATPNDADGVQRHSGAGRFARLRMRPMSMFESGNSSGEVSLAGLFLGELPTVRGDHLTVEALANAVVVGGWPALVDAGDSEARLWLRGYLDTIIEVDVQQIGTRRDPVGVRRVLTALGRHTASILSVAKLAELAGGEEPLSHATAKAYLDALERLMIVEDLPAWSPSMRSATPLKRSPKRFMVDPSLASFVSGGSVASVLRQPSVLGALLESLAVRDLRVYAGPLGGRLHHWRDNNANEVDIIVETDDGRWGAIEVKLNPNAVEAAAKGLLRFVSKVNTDIAGEPAFLAVVTGRGLAHRRPDGVIVVPIGTLGP